MFKKSPSMFLQAVEVLLSLRADPTLKDTAGEFDFYDFEVRVHGLGFRG